MRKSRDTFSGNLFAGEPQFDESGNLINPETGDVKQEAPSEALKLARRLYGTQDGKTISDLELEKFGYVRECERYLAKQRAKQEAKGQAVGK